MSKFDSLYNKFLNEEVSNMEDTLDARDMIASVGWVARDGISEEPFDFYAFMDEEDFESWNESQGLEKVDFKKGATEVMKYAKQHGADQNDLAELKQKLVQLGRDYAGHVFVLYGIEADLALGVL